MYNYYNRMEIIHVNGQNGAMAFQMPPNSNILLLDDTAPIVWLKQTDGAGYPTLTAYDIAVHKEPEPADWHSFEERLNRLEAMINESHSSTIESNNAKLAAVNVDD